MIEPLNTHYSMENPASVYDEESLTALELAGRTTGKVNECVNKCNATETHVKNEIARQDQQIKDKFDAQDEYLEDMHENVFPSVVREEFMKRFDGAFDDAMMELDNQAKGAYYNTRTRTVFPGNGYPTFSGGSADSGVTVHLTGSNIRVYLSNGKLTPINFTDIVTQLPDNAVLTDTGIDITVPQESALAIDLESGTFCIDSGNLTGLPFTAYVVLYNYYSNLSGEWWLRYAISTMTIAERGFVYISSDAPVTFTKDESNNGSVEIVIDGKLNVVCGDTVSSFLWENISDNIYDYIDFDGDKAKIRLGYRRTLVFNLTDNMLEIRTAPHLVQVDDIILAQNAWGVVVGGWLVTNYVRQKHIAEVTTPGEILEEHAQIDSTGKMETFAFFTDPHLCQTEEWKDKFHKYMNALKDACQTSGVDRVVCGGDWLGNDDLPGEAVAKLNYVNGYMRNNFRGYMPVLGNHDTNYQGVTLESEKGTNAWTGILSNETIANTLFRDEGRKNYYYVDSDFIRYIVLDSQCEGDITPDSSYDAKQAMWFGGALQEANKDVIIFIHNPDYDSNLMLIVKFFIGTCHAKGTYQGIDFSNSTSKVRFVICGHIHQDTGDMGFNVDTTETGDDIVPVITTTHMQEGGTPTFDLCTFKYDANGKATLIMTRVGAGVSRTFTCE